MKQLPLITSGREEEEGREGAYLQLAKGMLQCCLSWGNREKSMAQLSRMIRRVLNTTRPSLDMLDMMGVNGHGRQDGG